MQVTYLYDPNVVHFNHKGSFGVICKECEKECQLSPFVDDNLTPKVYWSKRKERVLCSTCVEKNPLWKFRQIREHNDIPFNRSNYRALSRDDPIIFLKESDLRFTFRTRFCDKEDEDNEQKLILDESSIIEIIGKGKYAHLLSTFKLSNPICYNERKYPTAEHFFQARKYLHGDVTLEHLNYVDIIIKSNVTDAIALGNQEIKFRGHHKSWINGMISKYKNLGVVPFADWEKVKIKEMKFAQELKFQNNNDCMKTLLETCNKKLVFNLSPSESSDLDQDFYDKRDIMAELLQDIRYDNSGYSKLEYPVINEMVAKKESEAEKQRKKIIQPPGSSVKEETTIILTKEQRDRIEKKKNEALSKRSSLKRKLELSQEQTPLTQEQRIRFETNKKTALGLRAKKQREKEEMERKEEEERKQREEERKKIQEEEERKKRQEEEKKRESNVQEYDEESIIQLLDEELEESENEEEEEEELEPSQKRLKTETPEDEFDNIPSTMPTLESIEYQEEDNQE